MNKYLLTPILSLLSFCFYAQDFKSDNVRYQTISWNDFFKKLDHNPKLFYYDIRSEAERNDSIKAAPYNQGKIKGAIETDFADFAKYYPEYLKHKDDTIYLYCSHSKRSRYLAKQLRDSSFAHVVNINGGLSYFNTLSESEMPYKNKYYTNSLKYKLASPSDFTKALKDKNYQLVDVRPDSLYYGNANIERGNSFGDIKSSLHISYDKIKDHLKLLDKNKTIMVLDNEGTLSPIAANYLIEKGYKTSVLLFGVENLTRTIPATDRPFLKTKYQMILPEELANLSKKKNIIIIDVRTEPEYNSTSKDNWKNVGKLKNAVSIPLQTLSKEKMAAYNGKKIVIYDMMMKEDVYEFAKHLKEFGIKDFQILVGGINQLKEGIYDYQKTELKSLLD
ncbi:rhodanese-like domain-containing protein [Flavobacterium johnsoniae]|uniref:rhodanese-like domain-containing protein n=1 Tax=Flavobacterium johnsoniae TaxID=986 RepID=UPI0016598C3E|nr:rhodanese-like domain-containing protein [Flavobacterium johnsoniae]